MRFHRKMHVQSVRKGIRLEDLENLKNSLERSQTILFQNWVEQNDSLNAFLHGSTSEGFKDAAGVLTHKFANDFKRFLSPFTPLKFLASHLKTIRNWRFCSHLQSYLMVMTVD